MLTGESGVTNGECHVVGYNVWGDFENARKQIGYCPQFDAIFPLLTVREHLLFYAKIKKIPQHLREGLIKKQLKAMNLEQYENKLAGTLSGGNKRKLSVALAMIGNPPVVFLDEPSAGMDPKARRFMWEIIAQISTRGKNSAVILTTHSMEEAEALSTNMGIMVAGQFKCFGSKQHIKNKFGTGYQVEIKYATLANEKLEEMIKTLQIQEFLRDHYPSCYKLETRKDQEFLVANKQACIAILTDILHNKRAANEFDNDEYFAKEIIEILNIRGFYPVIDLIRWENVIKNNFEAIQQIIDVFGELTVLEQYTPRFRYMVPKSDKSVGFFFSFMEKMKNDIEIDEYSASQTTLEQIFNNFARHTSHISTDRKFTQQSNAENLSDITSNVTHNKNIPSMTPKSKFEVNY